MNKSFKNCPWPYWIALTWTQDQAFKGLALQGNWIKTIKWLLTEKPYNAFVSANEMLLLDWISSWWHLLDWQRANCSLTRWKQTGFSHLHPRSQGLQIYSLHHRCQGSSWSQKVCCMTCVELRERGPGYRMAWGGQLLAPERQMPAVSHITRLMTSPVGSLLSAKTCSK